MTTCDRCYKDLSHGEHGLGVCPFEPRRVGLSMVGDECDVWIRHGLCNADGSPKRYTSKAAIHRDAAAKGLRNRVEHVPQRGTDKSPFTTRWV